MSASISELLCADVVAYTASLSPPTRSATSSAAGASKLRTTPLTFSSSHRSLSARAPNVRPSRITLVASRYRRDFNHHLGENWPCLGCDEDQPGSSGL